MAKNFLTFIAMGVAVLVSSIGESESMLGSDVRAWCNGSGGSMSVLTTGDSKNVMHAVLCSSRGCGVQCNHCTRREDYGRKYVELDVWVCGCAFGESYL